VRVPKASSNFFFIIIAATSNTVYAEGTDVLDRWIIAVTEFTVF
jgi:hypothetical protein